MAMKPAQSCHVLDPLQLIEPAHFIQIYNIVDVSIITGDCHEITETHQHDCT